MNKIAETFISDRPMGQRDVLSLFLLFHEEIMPRKKLEKISSCKALYLPLGFALIFLWQIFLWEK